MTLTDTAAGSPLSLASHTPSGFCPPPPPSRACQGNPRVADAYPARHPKPSGTPISHSTAQTPPPRFCPARGQPRSQGDPTAVPTAHDGTGRRITGPAPGPLRRLVQLPGVDSDQPTRRAPIPALV